MVSGNKWNGPNFEVTYDIGHTAIRCILAFIKDTELLNDPCSPLHDNLTAVRTLRSCVKEKILYIILAHASLLGS